MARTPEQLEKKVGHHEAEAEGAKMRLVTRPQMWFKLRLQANLSRGVATLSRPVLQQINKPHHVNDWAAWFGHVDDRKTRSVNPAANQLGGSDRDDQDS